MAPTCPYCGDPAELATGAQVYPHLPRLAAAHFWRCTYCPAWVGCHKGTDRPMGTLGDGRTRDLRRACHARFDGLWKHGYLPRKGAYKALARRLGVPFRDCHFSWFEAPELERALVAIDALWSELAPHVPRGTSTPGWRAPAGPAPGPAAPTSPAPQS
jgi:hypothetical protein